MDTDTPETRNSPKNIFHYIFGDTKPDLKTISKQFVNILLEKLVKVFVKTQTRVYFATVASNRNEKEIQQFVITHMDDSDKSVTSSFDCKPRYAGHCTGFSGKNNLVTFQTYSLSVDVNPSSYTCPAPTVPPVPTYHEHTYTGILNADIEMSPPTENESVILCKDSKGQWYVLDFVDVKGHLSASQYIGYEWVGSYTKPSNLAGELLT
jgi:hypothetical protein